MTDFSIFLLICVAVSTTINSVAVFRLILVLRGMQADIQALSLGADR